MIEIKNKKNCSGCSACAQICKKNCIIMKSDEEGFSYPFVDSTLCNNCEMCINVCPILNKKDDIIKLNKVYACKNKDDNIRLSSSSGGVFSLLAERIINSGGVVFGAAFDNNFKVVHKKIADINDIKKLRGSKYVQSDINETYIEAQKCLKDGQRVLFSGTPCQIAGLKSFLKKDYDKLLTVDFICFGVPSPMVFNSYLNSLKNKYKSEIKDISFRNKDTGWNNYNLKILFANGKIYKKNSKDDSYLRGFLKCLYIRPSCSDCKFKHPNNLGDITLGDYWGIKNYIPDFDDNKGISVVILNNEKGEISFNDIKNNLIYKKSKIEDVISANNAFVSSRKANENKHCFYNMLIKSGFVKSTKKYNKKPILSNIKNRIKRYLKSGYRFFNKAR